MGFKDYELFFVKEHFVNKKDSIFSKVKSYIYVYIEMCIDILKIGFHLRP